jgi:hypothetical protein
MREPIEQLTEQFKERWAAHMQINVELQKTWSAHRRNGGHSEKLKELFKKMADSYAEYSKVAKQLRDRM